MTLQIPQADDAERNVAAQCALTPLAVRRARSILTAHHFYNPMARRVFEAALVVGDLRGLNRVEEVARRAGLTESEIEYEIIRYATAWERPARPGRLVINAARRRQLMARLSDIYNGIAEGKPLVELVDDQMLRVLEVA